MQEQIGISTAIADDSGAIVLGMLPESQIRGGERRVTRTATLDGGCSLYDAGFSHGDRTWRVEARATEAEWEILWHIHQTCSLVYISVAEGYFSGAIESCRIDGERATLSILITEKIA
jgi:hypothetical protein